MKKTLRLTMAQALLKFIANQYISMDEFEQPFVRGVFGIFGHGNITGIGEALLHGNSGLTYYRAHNEQGMVHTATAFAKENNRLAVYACTSSIGPGATNMITGAACATVNRIPVLLLPGDIFACRQPDPVLQQLENTRDYTVSANDCFKPVSQYWDRILRPEQLMTACINAFRVLTDPIETGAVTLCLPQDTQCESYDYPLDFFKKRFWFIDRRSLSNRMIRLAVEKIKNAKRPLIIAGGGVHYSLACEVLNNFSLQSKIPVAETQAGKSALSWDHTFNVGGIGVTGSEIANQLAKNADLIIAVGTRLQDFTTASKTAFSENCEILQLNINPLDTYKIDAIPLLGDAKLGLEAIQAELVEYTTDLNYQAEIKNKKNSWNKLVDQLYSTPAKEGNSQLQVLGILNEFVTKEDTIVCAAGSLPGDLHRVWRSKAPKDYHLEYAYSCMGYEVAGGLGVRLAKKKGEVYVLVGDGSFLMLHSEILTSIQEHQKITIILLDNHGFQCIQNLQETQGSFGFMNELRFRDDEKNNLSGDITPVNFTQYAQALGVNAYFVAHLDTFKEALEKAKQSTLSTLIEIKVLPKSMSKSYETGWRVGVAATSTKNSVKQAYLTMQEFIKSAKPY